MRKYIPSSFGTLDEEYAKLLDRVDQLENEVRLLKKEKEKEEKRPNCTICMENPIQTALVPCGHTCCENCAVKIQRCHMCQGGNRNRIRIYL